MPYRSPNLGRNNRVGGASAVVQLLKRMPIFRALIVLIVASTSAVSQAQSTFPALSQPLPSVIMAAGGTSASIDLRNYFSVPGVTGQVAQFDTVLGKFNVELLAASAPQTVANFLAYVGDNAFASTLIHRSTSVVATAANNRIIQGGGYVTSGASIARKAPIPLESDLVNARGTLAMARTSDPNSATSEWFFNVDDNSAALGTGTAGGYAVFGRVIGGGMTVVDAIAAVPTYNISNSIFTNIPLRNYQTGQTIQVANEVFVNSVSIVPIYPAVGSAASVINYSGNFTAGGGALVTGVITGSRLSLTPLASGNTSLTISATDTNGNAVSSTIAITVRASPVFSAHPASQSVAAGQSVTFGATASAATNPTFQWQINGVNVGDVVGPTTSASVKLDDVQPNYAGLYTAVATAGGISSMSDPAIFGISSSSKVIGTGTELQPTDIPHPNGNIFDQVLVTGAAETITADPGQVTRTSYIDPNDDIVQVEFTGAGALSLVLDSASAAAQPVKYNQAVNYVKGRAGIVITGANETTNVSVFTVGRATAFDPTGAYNIVQPISETNNPANNGSPLFSGHSTEVYDGIADIAFIAISTTNGKFGGVRTSNARYSASNGYVGVYAPGVQFAGPVFIGDIDASGSATPLIFIGASPDTRITGGDLQQTNGQPVKVGGLTQLKFTAGGDSHGHTLPVQRSQGVLLQSGVDVGGNIVSYP